MKTSHELDRAGLQTSVWELNCLSSFCKRASCCSGACAEHSEAADWSDPDEGGGRVSPSLWRVKGLKNSLQLKNGCYDCYVCRIICCGSLLCSLSLGFSLSSGEMLSSELSVCRRWKVIFAYGIFSVQVSAKFLQNFLPHSPSEVLPYALVLDCTDRSSSKCSLHGVMGLLEQWVSDFVRRWNGSVHCHSDASVSRTRWLCWGHCPQIRCASLGSVEGCLWDVYVLFSSPPASILKTVKGSN